MPGTCIYQNRLLRALSRPDRDFLAPHLKSVELVNGDVLIRPNAPVQTVIFPEDCTVSVIASAIEGGQAEVGLIGPEGTTGISTILGESRSPLECVVQASGEALQLPTRILDVAMASRPDLNLLLRRYAHSYLVQMSSTALALSSNSVPERLARWLLMMQDRTTGSDIAITHETLAIMLGVRRAGVTLALQAVERRQLISKRRGVLTIVDRAGLEALAGDCYGTPEAELLRTLGIDLRRAEG